MPTANIEIQNLEKTYADGLLRRRRVHALRGVSFAVTPGEIFGLLGPNGAGKTTLIKILLGIVRKSGGQAEMLGFAAGDLRGRRRVGYLPENHRIPRHHTGNSALEYYGGLSGLGRGAIRSRTPAVLELVGLAQWGRNSVKTYSKGMLQRLGLAQALLHDPELLILDEPTDGVDPVGRSEMRGIMQRLRGAGKTIFINSHLLQEVELVCDRVAILNKGTLLRLGRVSELTVAPLTDLFLTLRGDEAAIRRAVGLGEILGWVPRDGGQVQLTVRVADQGAVDAMIDRLREAQVSIVEFTRHRQTLEEAFLQIVTPESQGT